MIRHRTKKQVRSFDIFKLIMTVILLLIILYTWRSCSSQTAGVASSEATATPAASGAEQAQATATEETAQPAAQAEATATPTLPPDTPTPEPQPATETPTVAAPVEVPTVAVPALSLPSGERTAGEVALSGTGAPESELEIVVDGQVVGTATAGSDGTWQTTVELPEAGEYEVQVRAIDSAGAALAESEPTTLQLEAAETETSAEVEVTPPTLTLPAGELAPGEVALSGVGEPGSEVAIVVEGQTVSTATVDSDGSWQTTVELPDEGEYEVQVQSVDEAGAAVAESEPATLTLTPEKTTTESQTVVEAEAITSTLTTPPGETEAVAEAGAITPTLSTPPGELAPGEVALSGFGEPGSEVAIVVEGQIVSTATVGSDGEWETTAELPDAGEYELQVQAVDNTGAVQAASEPATLRVSEAGTTAGATESQPAADQAYIVQRDDWLSKLADKFYGDMFAYQAIVDATNTKAGEDSSFTVITNPDRIEIGQKLWIPASP